MRFIHNAVHRTKSGLFIRRDYSVGLLVYSPYTGLVFVVHPKDMDSTLSWLELRNETGPGGSIRDAIGFGWDKSVEIGEFPMHNYLEDKGKWDTWPWPKRFPILINWFITGNCPLKCKYCDAEDLMRYKRTEPDLESLRKIASRILSYNPLVVVLTGGEPLLSPHLADCIKLLHNRTGIVVDTNGIYVNKEAVGLFGKHQVVLRISMDSTIPRINDDLRCFSNQKLDVTGVDNSASSLKSALRSLCLCIDDNLPVTVQTVATHRTISDIPSLGDTLYRIGVRSWRIHIVSLSRNDANYESLRVSTRSRRNASRELMRSKQRWKGMHLQVLSDVSRNSVVIISPDGAFLTESNAGMGKILLDGGNPYSPRLNRLFWNVSPKDHAERYLSNPGLEQGRLS